MSSRPGPWASGRFDVEGHRGAKGLVVENTLASFAAAYSAGVTGVELDVRRTADGHLVVWHDPVLLPLKCLPTGPDLIGARVADLTLAQLRTVDIGSRALPGFPGQRTSPGARIATLSEVLRHGLARAPDVWWTIEVKVDPRDQREADQRQALVEGVLSIVHDLGLEGQCFVHSFDWSVLELSAQLAPDVLRSALVEASVTWLPGSPWTGSVTVGESHDEVCEGAAAVGAHVISPEHVLVDAALVDRAHALGLSVLPWTVNDPKRMVELAETGVDGIVSDYPDRALAVLAPGA
ncbi:glycerophosphodiester phosphodiesterase family protein [Terrabacter sp. MAHUQ-38]|uniref:glycerophosphodiester phosphodiesterase family protein n=1 Tax=unclassified Terrabacter TaxID=2630222 RepID=UPI00165D5A67|nr:glycerophosphodiester phosphodiesterase family protein [Terrabacter sp. MAHUQ-38]MBC9823303.1 glycerophosphodiester phosphodiesterase [Terrabacter sp. MAHUQ-38]